MTISVVIVSILALALALALAFLQMQMVLTTMSRRIAAPIRSFIQRQRDRRNIKRDTPDRRRAA